MDTYDYNSFTYQKNKIFLCIPHYHKLHLEKYTPSQIIFILI